VLIWKIYNKAFMSCALWKETGKAAMADFKAVFRKITIKNEPVRHSSI
jgi:hypothetical protein